MFESRRAPRARSVLLVAVMLGVTGLVPTVAAADSSSTVKKVNLKVAVTPDVKLKGTKGQCLVTSDGYNIDFDADDYPSLGEDGGLASGGPGPATDPDQRRMSTAFSATIDGIFYVEDDSNGLDAINRAVTLKVNKKTIKFKAYPIIAPETETPATMTGTVKCK